MKRKEKLRFLMICSIFFSVIILMTFQKVKISYAQINDHSLDISSNLLMTEYAEDVKNKENISSIAINLPSSTWTISDIALNFTGIKLEQEIKTIEENVGTMETIDVEARGYGVQINITESTLIYGVHIYASRTKEPLNDVFVQISGYDNNTNIPNGTIYGSTLLNVSYVPNWYLQTFATPISLSMGQYYLVVNGTALQENDPVYFWGRARNPNNPMLYTSFYNDPWKDGKRGPGSEPFLYKLVQKVHREYYPEDINMSIDINHVDFQVINGINSGEGSILISNLNFSPNNEIFSIPIKNNISIKLAFNLSYSIKIKNLVFWDGFVRVSQNSDNQWTLSSIINRFYDNHTLRFNYPKSWYNLTVFKNDVDITEETSNIGEILTINNQSISEGTELKIKANSPKVDFNVSTPVAKYKPGQNLRVVITNTELQGNLTFKLNDPFGFEDYSEIKEIIQGETIFSYLLPTNPLEGEWTIYVFWNNGTDAGMQIQAFQFSIPFKLDPRLVLNISLTVILSLASGISSYQLVRRYKKARDQHRQEIFDNYLDVLNLDYIIVIEKNTGLNIYEQIIGGDKADLALISGFLEAIRNFGIELSGSEDHSQTIKLEYQRLKILISEFKNFRIISIMKENPSQNFISSLEPLSRDIDNIYSDYLEKFNGEISKFKNIKELLERHLQISLVYPLKIELTNDVKLDMAEKNLVNKAIDTMKKKGSNHFYVSYLLNEKEFSIRIAEKILKLIKKDVFQSIL